MMDEFRADRERMVEWQLIARGIKDPGVLDAMRKVPRHLFVPEEERHRAYEDSALPIGFGQTISQPYMVGAMTELLELQGDEKVLEIGTGSGYQSAVLAELAGTVYSIERVAELTALAERNLSSAGYKNVMLRTSDGTEGWIDEAPFDRVLVTAGAPGFPGPLLDQLSKNGIGVAPTGARRGQRLLQIRKEGGKISERFFIPCIFVPLIGKHGWEE